MSRVFTFIVLLCFFSGARANDNKDITEIEQLVSAWNNNHNTKNIEAFKLQYAPTLYFYGKYADVKQCLKSKQKFLRNSYSQQIVTPVSITKFSSGAIKCSFTKSVTYKQTTKEYPAYIVLERRGNKYLIIGESDLLTDQNLHAGMELGTEIQEKDDLAQSHAFVYVIVISSATFFVLMYVKRKRNYKRVTNSFVPYANRNNAETKPLNTAVTDHKEKGDAFEKWVIERFNSKYFKIKEWRSDKYHAGLYAASNMMPDLVLELKSNGVVTAFAVECKWRSAYFQNTIELAKEYQLKNYKEYALKNSLPVFIILGVGGQPADPSSIFIIPVEELDTNVLTKNELSSYFKKSKGTFYFNAESKMLS
ncbi:hypothetical protein I5907_13195 [Panacibacter sp. DH6]|uniref:DUF4019 domain-containing protein n=1 Tax=Panacibacter microcysteis TaxID=2793269 RepID=A0A931E516_9BACT|nr:hypothetical protein [Panacibacter microcysteis]MBG9377193.1 hypothetical protein [Panacibacter microcysteis]